MNLMTVKALRQTIQQQLQLEHQQQRQSLQQ